MAGLTVCDKCHKRDHEAVEYALPRVETGLSVEAALAELQDLMDHNCDVTFQTVGWVVITVWADSIIPMELLRVRRSTLDQAMDQVRAWSKSRDGSINEPSTAPPATAAVEAAKALLREWRTNLISIAGFHKNGQRRLNAEVEQYLIESLSHYFPVVEQPETRLCPNDSTAMQTGGATYLICPRCGYMEGSMSGATSPSTKETTQ